MIHRLLKLTATSLRWFVGRMACLLLLASFCLPGHAQSVVIEPAQAKPARFALKLADVAVLRSASPQLNLDDVLAGRSGAFVPQDGLNIDDPEWDHTVLWMRLTLQAVPIAADQVAAIIHVLEFQKPFIDDIRLYLPPSGERQNWQVQASGDHLAKRDWFVKGLSPRFLLPDIHELADSPDGRQVMYVRIEHSVPLAVKAKILSAAQTSERSQTVFLALGLAFGAMLITAVLVLMQALWSRDSIFYWFGLYAISALLALMSFSGLAHAMLWPVSGLWPSTAPLFWLLVAAAAQLQFCRVLYEPQGIRRWASKSAIILAGVCVAIALLFPFVQSAWITFFSISLAMILPTIGLTLLLVFLAWRQGRRLALVWLITFVPLFFTLVMSLGGSLGYVHADWLENMTTHAGALEVVLLGMALQWYARERHGVVERAKALASTDPLTGFSSAEAFHTRLQRDWSSPKTKVQDVAVAYVQLRTQATNAAQADKLLTRCIRALRAATREHDMVARLDDQFLAIVLPNISLGDELSQRLSRIVALGLMPDQTMPEVSTLRFRIVATTRRHFRRPLAELDTQMREFFSEEKRWDKRPIRVIDHLNSSAVFGSKRELFGGESTPA